MARHALAAALSAVVSQRLVRRLCPKCSRPHAGQRLAVGCAQCALTGFFGRVGLFELLEISDALRQAIAGGASSVSLGELGRRWGYEPLTGDGRAKLASGETTPAELARVIAWPK